MHAMIVDLDAGRLERSQIAFLEAGIHVTGSSNSDVAETCLRRAVVDVLVLDADCGAQRIAELTALAERRNPRLVTLMLARDVGTATDIYSDVINSLHCVLDGTLAPHMVARMAQASLAGRAACKMTAVRAVQNALAPRPVFQTTRRKPAAPAGEAVLA